MSQGGKEFECHSIKYNIIDRLLRYYNIHISDKSEQESTKVDKSVLI